MFSGGHSCIAFETTVPGPMIGHIKEARTIADLVDGDALGLEHICGTVPYRTLYRQLWT
ncbi:MAG: hypothetical protein JWM99_4612 [Verrucomicrobiales bacterium]|nr:hypothetical protein [Verrucomicrobiales bacterium]